MRKLLFITCLFITVFKLQASTYDVKTEKALLQQLSSAPQDSTRLNVLNELIKIVGDNPEVSSRYIKALLDEAKKQQNNKYLCKAYLYNIIEAYNKYDIQEVNKWVKLLEPLAQKEKLYNELFKGKSCAITLLLITGEYERMEKETRIMLQEAQNVKSVIGIIYAYQSLGYVQAYTYRYEKSAETFEKAFAISSEANDYSTTIQLCDRLIETYAILDNKEKQFNYIQERERKNNDYLRKHPELKKILKNDLLLTDLHYLNYYLDINRLDLARKHFDQSEKLFTKDYPTYEQYYRKARLKYFSATHEYEKRIAEIDSLISIIEVPIDFLFWRFNQAGDFVKTGKVKEALTLYKSLWPQKDSVQIALIKQQTEELKKHYDAENLLLEQANTNKITQYSFITLIIVISLILICFMIHTFRVQSNLSKAEKEQRKMSREMEQANAAKERFLSNISSTINVPLNMIVKNSLALASDEQYTPEERLETSQTITSTSAELMKLINNILDLSRLEAGMMKYSTEKIEVVSMLKSLIYTVAGESIQLTDKLPQDTLVWVNIDSHRLMQVIKTLIEKPQLPDQKIDAHLEVFRDESILKLGITNSFLSIANPTQDIIIYNEINNKIITHFGGKYEIQTDKGTIAITLPIIRKESNIELL